MSQLHTPAGEHNTSISEPIWRNFQALSWYQADRQRQPLSQTCLPIYTVVLYYLRNYIGSVQFTRFQTQRLKMTRSAYPDRCSINPTLTLTYINQPGPPDDAADVSTSCPESCQHLPKVAVVRYYNFLIFLHPSSYPGLSSGYLNWRIQWYNAQYLD